MYASLRTLVFGLAFAMVPAVASAAPISPVGIWEWNNEGTLTFNADGTCVHSAKTNVCNWKVGDSVSPEHVIVFWDKMTRYDRMTPAADGTLTGHPNGSAVTITARRPGPIGVWNYQVGTAAPFVLTVTAGGTCAQAGSNTVCNWKVGDSVSPTDIIVFFDGRRRYDRLKLGTDGRMTGNPNGRSNVAITATRK